MPFHPRLECLIRYVGMIDSANCIAMIRLLEDEGERIALSPGSTHNHQTWPGGYVDHILGMLEHAEMLYDAPKMPLPFTIGDAVLVILLHDIEKPWKYVDNPDGTRRVFEDEDDIKSFLHEIVQSYRFKLNDMHLNALKYAHSEGKDYRAGKRVMNELAAFLHVCDVWSARIEFDRHILPPLED